MSLTTCKGCGIPKRIAFMHRWRDEGILESKMGGVRAIMVEREVFAGTLDYIQDRLGLSIEHIIIDAKRRDAKIYVDEVLSGAMGAVIRFAPLRRLGYLIMIRQASYIGLAKAKLLYYRPGRRFIGRASPVYHPALFVGDVCGAFESIDRIRSQPEYGVIAGACFMELNVDKELHGEERLELEKVPEVPARADYDRCPVCGVPLQVRELRWDTREGKIIDTVTGEWIIYIDVGGLSTILRELERELGEDIPRMVAEFTFNTYLRLIEEYPGSYLSDLAFMKIRGFGVPAADKPTAGELQEGIEIRNAFNGPIVAGLVAAVCGGAGAEYDWDKPEPGTVRVRVSGRG